MTIVDQLWQSAMDIKLVFGQDSVAYRSAIARYVTAKDMQGEMLDLKEHETLPINKSVFVLTGTYELIGQLGTSNHKVVRCPETKQCFIIP